MTLCLGQIANVVSERHEISLFDFDGITAKEKDRELKSSVDVWENLSAIFKIINGD